MAAGRWKDRLSFGQHVWCRVTLATNYVSKYRERPPATSGDSVELGGTPRSCHEGSQAGGHADRCVSQPGGGYRCWQPFARLWWFGGRVGWGGVGWAGERELRLACQSKQAADWPYLLANTLTPERRVEWERLRVKVPGLAKGLQAQDVSGGRGIGLPAA